MKTRARFRVLWHTFPRALAHVIEARGGVSDLPLKVSELTAIVETLGRQLRTYKQAA